MIQITDIDSPLIVGSVIKRMVGLSDGQMVLVVTPREMLPFEEFFMVMDRSNYSDDDHYGVYLSDKELDTRDLYQAELIDKDEYERLIAEENKEKEEKRRSHELSQLISLYARYSVGPYDSEEVKQEKIANISKADLSEWAKKLLMNTQSIKE